MATGTWTRQSTQLAALGPDVIYNNTAPSGYFSTVGSAQASQDYSLIDEGRVPSLGSSIQGSVPVNRDRYNVNGLTFSYCSDVVGPNVGITFRVYDSYQPCDLVTNPAGPLHLAGEISGTGLPGGSAAGVACWTITLDVTGGGEFCMQGDGGPAFPGEDGMDAFGVEWTFNGIAGSNTGPLLSGDPDWTGSVPGAALHGGTGTYYEPTGACAGHTGLDTQDFFAVDGPGAPFTPGCTFFSGYKNLNGCGGGAFQPFSSFDLVLLADQDTSTCVDVSVFCDPASSGSSGLPVELSVDQRVSAGSGYHLDAMGGQAGSPGYFLVSAGATQMLPVGGGTLCLDAPIGRYNGRAGGALNSVGEFDLMNRFTNLSGTSGADTWGFDLPSQLPGRIGGSIQAGTTWYFQLWYDDMGAGGQSNFSNGLAITF